MSSSFLYFIRPHVAMRLLYMRVLRILVSEGVEEEGEWEYVAWWPCSLAMMAMTSFRVLPSVV